MGKIVTVKCSAGFGTYWKAWCDQCYYYIATAATEDKAIASVKAHKRARGKHGDK